MTTVAWVIGGRGLLGRAVSAAISQRNEWILLDASPLDWTDIAHISKQVQAAMRHLLAATEAARGTWAVVWAAGAAVTASPWAQLEVELEELRSILDAIGSAIDESTPRGAIFYASSAGGVYAGSTNPPFSEESVAVPISPYGRFKMGAESTIIEFATEYGVSSLVGRIANLYGPGQKLEKMQGVISQIAKAQFSPTPASIYVALDTTRDYLFVSDCASLICDALERLEQASRSTHPCHVTKILASGQGVTIGALLGHFRTLSKNRPNVMLGYSPVASFQAPDLRLRSTVWPELDRRALTPLPAGIHATMMDILSNLQGGGVSAP